MYISDIRSEVVEIAKSRRILVSLIAGSLVEYIFFLHEKRRGLCLANFKLFKTRLRDSVSSTLNRGSFYFPRLARGAQFSRAGRNLYISL